MTDLPNLAGVATKDLVEHIGSGRFSASYINWSRSLNLLRTHAPGWMVECVTAEDGSLLHRAPVGAYLLIRFRHVDGSLTTAIPQAVMDNRNAAIPYDKITARDVTDTQRRGACLAAAMTFGLAYELWAKQPLESGYGDAVETQSQPQSLPLQQAVPSAPATKPAATKEQFLEAAIEKGLTTFAAEALVAKLQNNFAGGIARLNEKDAAWVAELNKAHEPEVPQDPKPKRSAKTKPAPEENGENW